MGYHVSDDTDPPPLSWWCSHRYGAADSTCSCSTFRNYSGTSFYKLVSYKFPKIHKLAKLTQIRRCKFKRSQLKSGQLDFESLTLMYMCSKRMKFCGNRENNLKFSGHVQYT